MKKRYYIKTAFVSLMAVVLLSSCLKDDGRYSNFAGAAPVADFPVSANANLGSFTTATLDKTKATNQVNFLVDVSAPTNMSTPVTVTTIVDQAALTAYNTSKGTNYLLLPASTYTVTSLTLTLTPSIEQVISASEPIVGAPVTLPAGLGAVTFTVNTAAVQALPA